MIIKHTKLIILTALVVGLASCEKTPESEKAVEHAKKATEAVKEAAVSGADAAAKEAELAAEAAPLWFALYRPYDYYSWSNLRFNDAGVIRHIDEKTDLFGAVIVKNNCNFLTATTGFIAQFIYLILHPCR